MQIDPISLFKRLISKPRKMSYKDDVLATFRQFIKRAKAEKNEYAFDHPALLSPKHLAEIADQSPDDFANLSSPGPMAVAYLHELIDDITKHRTTYPVGRGPIERLQGRHRANEITLETAAQEASSKLSRLLSPIYIWAVSNLAQDLAQTLDWRLAVELMTILFGAVDNAPSDHEGFRMRVHAIRAWLDVVARALSHVPDGRLYEDALRRGKWLVDEADKRGNRALHSEILHRLGVLNLDPYILGKGVSNFTSDIQNWKIRQDNESQSAIIFGNRYKHMPDVVDALQLAEKYLSAAAAMRRGFGLAITSKALAQARYWLAIAGKEQDPKLMERLEKSLKTEWNRLERFRAFIKESGPGAVEVKTDIDLPAGGGDVTPESDSDFIDRFLNRTPEEITISEPDIFTLLLSVIQTSHMTAEKDPAAGMRVWEHGLKVAVLPPVQDLQLKMLYDEGLILLEKLLTGDRLNLATANSASEIEAEAVRIASLPDHENETIALAIAATISGHGEVALNLLKANEVRTCNAWARYARLTTYLVAVSHIHAAVDLYHADAYGPALTHYMKSVAGLAELQLRDLALHMWRRMEDVAGKISSGDLTAVIVDEIGATLLNAESTLGPAAGFVGRQAIRKLLGVMVDEVLFKKDPEGFLQVQFELFRIANGFRYGTVLNTRQRYNWQRDPTGTLLLQPVAKLLDTKSNADDAPPTGELLLGSYLGAAEQRQGSTEADVRANLMRAYDDYLNSELYRIAHHSPMADRTWRDVGERLGDKTILMTYAVSVVGNSLRLDTNLIAPKYFGATDEIIGNVEDVVDFTLGTKDMRGHLDHLGSAVVGARVGITREPTKGRLVSKSGRQGLGYLSRLCIGERLSMLLSQLRAEGFEHLCIVPFGSLHFAPFHLFGFEGGLLVDSWRVTFLPSVELLFRDTPASPRPRELFAAFGVSFGRDSGSALPEIKEAAREADELAAMFNITARVDNRSGFEASKHAIMSALANAQVVHIATHGQHNAYAPSFQCMYAAPQTARKRADEIIYAYELLGMDLSALELITLSACETALGRVDVSGNLRGLPANLFMQGARTIVGTLWEVESSASQCFFTSFYRAIKEGVTKLDAFARAQSETRSQFPAYRDWGPFYLSGDWRRSLRGHVRSA